MIDQIDPALVDIQKQKFSEGKNFPVFLYSNHLKPDTMVVRYSNGLVYKWQGPDYIRLLRLLDYHSNFGLFCPLFRCHLNTGPFDNRTIFDHLNTRLVRYSDGYCMLFFSLKACFVCLFVCYHFYVSLQVFSSLLKIYIFCPIAPFCLLACRSLFFVLVFFS